MLVISGNYSPYNSINSEVAPWSCSNRSTRVAIKFQTTGNYFPFYLAPCYVVASSPAHTHAHHDMCLLSRLWHRIEKLCLHPYLPQKPFKSELHCGKRQQMSLSTVGRMQEWWLPLLSHTRLFQDQLLATGAKPSAQDFSKGSIRQWRERNICPLHPMATWKAVLRANINPSNAVKQWSAFL